MTYGLRRLRLHGLITRIPHTHRYQVTDTGLSTARFLSVIHDRLLPTGLCHLTEQVARPLRTADRANRQAIETLNHATGLAA